MWISHWPWSWSCDQVFWNAKPSEIEQVLDHLTLDVTIQLRCGMKTVEKINDVNQSTQVAVVLDVTLPSPRPEIKLISPLHKIVLITCSFIFQIPSPPTSDSYVVENLSKKISEIVLTCIVGCQDLHLYTRNNPGQLFLFATNMYLAFSLILLQKCKCTC